MNKSISVDSYLGMAIEEHAKENNVGQSFMIQKAIFEYLKHQKLSEPVKIFYNRYLAQFKKGARPGKFNPLEKKVVKDEQL